MRPFLASLLLLAVAACGGPTDDAEPAERASGFTDASCPDLLVVGVRGQQQSPNANHGLGTEVRLLATDLTKRIQAGSNTSVRLESVDYESNPPPDLTAYDSAVSVGARALQDRLAAVESECGDDTSVAVIGFSMGAQVVHTALHERGVGSIKLVTMIADPHRDPLATYDVDAFGQEAPQTGSLGAGPKFGALADRTVSFCAGEDDVCNYTPGEPRTAVDTVHKHFYEDPSHVAAMAEQMLTVLQRSGF